MNEWKQLCPHLMCFVSTFPSHCPVTSSTFDFRHSNWWLYLQKSKCSVQLRAALEFHVKYVVILFSVSHTWSKNDSNTCSWMEILEIMSRLATNNILHLKDFALYRSFCHSLSTHPLEWRNSTTCLSTQLSWMLTGITTTFCGLSTQNLRRIPHSTIKHVNTFHTFHAFHTFHTTFSKTSSHPSSPGRHGRSHPRKAICHAAQNEQRNLVEPTKSSKSAPQKNFIIQFKYQFIRSIWVILSLLVWKMTWK